MFINIIIIMITLEGGAEEHKYLEALHSQNILFIPMAVETFDGWGLESRPVFATLVDRILDRTGQAKSCVINQLYQSNMPVQ